MIRLTDFVEKHKKFIVWLNKKHHYPAEYVKRFENIFSVTVETELLQEIWDIKDELEMLAAVFNDQIKVLTKADKVIGMSRKAELEEAGVEINKSRKAWFKNQYSALNIQQQSEKHAKHVRRMRDQTSQAYQNVCLVSLRHLTRLIMSTISLRISWISSSSKRTC